MAVKVDAHVKASVENARAVYGALAASDVYNAYHRHPSPFSLKFCFLI
jgi:hypothetical protein